MSRIKKISKKIDYHCSFEYLPRIGPLFTISIFGKDYNFCFCHRIPNRSFNICGIQMPLCSRCMGIIIGVIFAFPILFTTLHLPTIICFLGVIPLIVDGLIQNFLLIESTNKRRFITGLLAGFSLMNVIFIDFNHI